MKKIFSKTLLSLAIMTFFCLSSVFSVNAQQATSNEEYTYPREEDFGSSNPLSVKSETLYIMPNDTGFSYQTLDKATSNARLIVNCTSNSTSGALFIYVYNSDGTLVSDDWICGVNEMAIYEFDKRLSAGTYEIKIIAGLTNAEVRVFVSLEG